MSCLVMVWLDITREKQGEEERTARNGLINHEVVIEK